MIMAKAKRGLGKGLGAFFGEEVVQEVAKDQENEKKEITSDKEEKASVEEKETENENGEFFVKISRIEPNREQPRKDFAEEQLQELADSIRQYGVLQPLLVQKKGDLYEIIAGERRWRAAKLAGLKELPVVVREYGKQQAMEIALIENVQRGNCVSKADAGISVKTGRNRRKGFQKSFYDYQEYASVKSCTRDSADAYRRFNQQWPCQGFAGDIGSGTAAGISGKNYKRTFECKRSRKSSKSFRKGSKRKKERKRR